MKQEVQTLIIAELSANHGGDLEIAKETIRAAKRAGADAIKLQTYTADTMTINSEKEDFLINKGTAWDGMYLYDLYKTAYTPWEWHKELFDLAKEEGLLCFSSPFDFSAVDFLEELDCPIYKIASFEITDIPLIEYVASKGKPMIISTGIADEEDIKLAIETCYNAGNKDVTILKCTSNYPTPPEDSFLLNIPYLKEKYNVKSGLSDHTTGIEAPVVAVSLGATVIEKHFILKKSIGGPDAHFSLDEKEFTEMVNAVRTAEKMLKFTPFVMTPKKEKSREFSRSLYIVEDVKEGEILDAKNIRAIRPGFGLHPKYLKDILGKTFKKPCEKGTPLSFELFD